MRDLRLQRPSPALVVSVIALSVSLGGTGYAAIVLPANSVGAKQIKKNAVTGAKVKNRSLVAKDFKANQLPRGAAGPTGPAGPAGAQGPQGLKGDKGDPGANGSPDTPQAVLDKVTQVDGAGSGLDADTIDGAAALRRVGTAAPGFNVGSVPADTCAEQASFGILGLETTDFLLVERQTPPTSGILDSFRITAGPPVQVAYTVCNTTSDAIDPPPADFRVLATRSP